MGPSRESVLRALSAPDAPLPSIDIVSGRLRAQGFVVHAQNDGSVVATAGKDGAPVKVLWARGPGLDGLEVEWLDAQPPYRGLAERAAWHVTAVTAWRGVAVIAYHQQLRVLVAAAGEPVACVDVNAQAARPGSWALDAADAKTPPAPDALFLIHVSSRDAEPTWLHTHGLARLGHPELEIIEGFGARTEGLVRVLSTAASLVVDGVKLTAGEATAVGPGLNVVPVGPGDAAGLYSARELEVRARCPAAGGAFELLLTGDVARPSRLAARLSEPGGSPPMFRSAGESVRAALLARERWEGFGALEAEHRGHDGWSFRVKLGVESRDGAGGAEHLWFEVQAVEPGRVDAVLLSTPLVRAGLSVGARGWYSLEKLSDWRVESPEGSFTPESILRFRR